MQYSKKRFSVLSISLLLCLSLLTLSMQGIGAPKLKVIKLTNGIFKPAKKCPVTFEFIGEIVVNKPGTVYVQWERSDGVKSAPIKLNFKRLRLKKTIRYNWLLNGIPGTALKLYKTRIVVLKPNMIGKTFKYSNWAGSQTKCRPKKLGRRNLK